MVHAQGSLWRVRLKPSPNLDAWVGSGVTRLKWPGNIAPKQGLCQAGKKVGGRLCWGLHSPRSSRKPRTTAFPLSPLRVGGILSWCYTSQQERSQTGSSLTSPTRDGEGAMSSQVSLPCASWVRHVYRLLWVRKSGRDSRMGRGRMFLWVGWPGAGGRDPYLTVMRDPNLHPRAGHPACSSAS